MDAVRADAIRLLDIIADQARWEYGCWAMPGAFPDAARDLANRALVAVQVGAEDGDFKRLYRRAADALRHGPLVRCPWCAAERTIPGALLHIADHCADADETSKRLAWPAMGADWDEPGWPAGMVLADHLETSGHAAAACALRLRSDVATAGGAA